MSLPISLLAPFEPGTVPIFVGLALALFATALGLAWHWRPGAWSDSRGLLALAILMRLALIPVEPVLGRDIYRYLWEGRVSAAGFNPYVQAPADPALVALRDAYWMRVDHPEIPTVYPPLSQAVFALTARAGTDPGLRLVVLKTVFVAGDIGILLLLFALARRRPVRWPLYAFHPVSLLEVAWNGHVDVLAVFFLVLALYCVLHERYGWAGLALLAGVWSKLVPLAALPFVARPRLRSLVGIAAGGFLGLALGARYFDEAMLTGLAFFSRFWTFNAPLFSLVAFWQGAPAAAAWRLLSAALVGLAFLFYFFRPGDRSLAERLQALYFTVLAVSPVVHPWYTLILLPLLALTPRPSGSAFAGLALSGTVFLSYEVYGDYLAAGQWQERPAVLAAVWGPVLVAGLFGLWRGRQGDYPGRGAGESSL